MVFSWRGNGAWFRGAFAVSICVLSLAQVGRAQQKTLWLNKGWEFRQRIEAPGGPEAKWYPAEVPGVVQTDLLRNKLIPDPFFRSNEAGLQWIENASWEYRSTLQATPEVLRHAHVEVVFEGLDGPAQVSLNDKPILIADNAFREWRVDIKQQLKPGANQLLIVFPSPIKAATIVAATDFWRQQTQTPEKSYLRKPAYEYGWDWGPRFVLSGIWRPAKLDLWDDAKLSNVHVRQLDITSDLAHLVVETEITATQKGSAKVTVDYEQGGKKASVSRDVELNAGVNHIDLPLDIAHPTLWYPNGYGNQFLYTFHTQLSTGNHLQDERAVRTGLRSIVLRREVDQWAARSSSS